MKPFNLQEALAGKPFCNEKGERYDEIHHLKTHCSSYMRVLVLKNGFASYFAENGEGLNPDEHEHLYMAGEPSDWYLNVYEYGERWKTLEEANRYGANRAGILKITMQDGRVTSAEVVA